MATRRTFLTANLTGAAAWALGDASFAAPAREDSTEVATAEYSGRDFWNDWPSYLAGKMSQARSSRLAKLAEIRTAAQARERAAMVRSRVWELVGGPFEKTPLNPQLTGSIDRGAYRIEKVIYESLPQVYVTANLYVPQSGARPFPAIISPLGHTRDGKAYRSYQYLFQNLARKGYVVLAFDPYGQGERAQYLDPKTGQGRLSPTGEHYQAGRPMLLWGDSLALYRAWDGIRAVDYLLNRPEVDAARIGCTGHSGGATMTIYLAALEPRLRAAVVVEGNSENMAGPFFDPPGAVADAEQNLVGGLPFGIDRGDLLGAFVPKPLLISYTTHDVGQTYSPVYEAATREIYQALQQEYGLFGAREKVSLFASHLPHDLDFFHRTANYQWFNRWLGNPGAGSGEADFDASPDGSLDCTTTGQVLTSLGGRSIVRVNLDRAREIMRKSPLAGAGADPALMKHQVRADLTGLLALPEVRTPLQAEVLSSAPRKNVLIEEFQFESEPGLRLTGWFLRPAQNRSPRPAILYVNERVDAVVAEPSSMEGVLASGHAVCALSLRGLGISTPRFPRGSPRTDRAGLPEDFAWMCLTMGRSVIAQRVWDVSRGLDYLRSRPDVDASQIRVLGVGGAGLAALLAVAMDDRPRSILLDRTLASYASILDSEEYSLALDWFLPGILRHCDLPDLVASLRPRPCWIVNAVDARGSVLPESSWEKQFKTRSGIEWGALEHVRATVVPQQVSAAMWKQWLQNT